MRHVIPCLLLTCAISLRSSAQVDSLFVIETVPDVYEESGLSNRLNGGMSAASGYLSVQSAPGDTRMRAEGRLASWLRAGVAVRKEPGESVRWDPAEQWLGGEHTSGYIAIERHALSVYLGDYRVRTPGGLSSFSARRRERSRRYPARSTVGEARIQPYAGYAQSPAPRGWALTWTSKGIHAAVFSSRRREDGAVRLGVPSLRSGWRIDSASALEQRRRLPITASGGWMTLKFPGRNGFVGASRAEFQVPGRAWTVSEIAGAASLRPHWRIEVAAGHARGTPWRLLDISTTVSMSETDVVVYRTDQPATLYSAWGAPARIQPHTDDRRTVGISVRARSAGSHPDVAAGWFRRRNAPGEVYLRLDAEQWFAEIRYRGDVPVNTAHPAAYRARTSWRPVMRDRVSTTMDLLVTSDGGRAVGIRMSMRDWTIARIIVWGTDSDPWATLTVPGSAGTPAFVRLSSPRSVTVVRVQRGRRIQRECRILYDGQFVAAVTVTLTAGRQ